MKENPRQRFLCSIMAVFLLCVGGFALNRILRQKIEAQEFVRPTIAYAEALSEDADAVLAFKEAYPHRAVLLACEEDVTNDGIKDVLMIYQETGSVFLVVGFGADTSVSHYSNPIPAPVENQKIQFKNIDNKDEMEFMLSGEKKGQIGYGIYRMIDGQPVNLFGEGMEDCC